MWCGLRKNQIIIYILINMFIAYYYVYIYYQDTSFEKVYDVDLQARYNTKNRPVTPKDKSMPGCKIPRLDPFSKQILRYRWRPSPIVCSGQDWVRCYYSTCKVVPEILNTTSNIQCIYKDIIFLSDNGYAMGVRNVVFNHEKYILKKSDHVKIWCSGTQNNSTVNWVGVATGFRTSVRRNPVPPGREESLNVLMLGFDSTSKNGFIRQMPKSYKHLIKVMGGVVLNGHNLVGSGTTAALIPILTGMSILEVPNAKYGKTNRITVDSIPLIFYTLKDYGYRTAYFEDMPWIGTFQYRFNGFRHQPADHYLRMFYLEEDKLMPRLLHCVGDTRMHKLMMNITDQFLHLDGQKFILTFIADITHDRFNVISTADNDLVEFLNNLKNEGVLENTLVIVMGDHGARYEAIRNTFQGKLEEYLPLMVLLLPEKLQKLRPSALANLKHNTNVLTTHFDIHTTLLDVLNLKSFSNKYKTPDSDLPRAMSLLEKIPKNRTCKDAGVHPHFCACTEWYSLSKNHSMYNRVGNALAEYIDSIVEEKRELCARRKLASIKWVLHYTPKEDHRTRPGDSSTRASIKYYQAKIIMNPGNSIFEGTMMYNIETDSFYITPTYISGPYAVHVRCSCLDKNYVHLFPFCYCKNLQSKTNATTPTTK